MGTLTKKIQRHEKLEMIDRPEHRPEDRAEQRRHPDHSHDLVHLVGTGGAGHDRLPDRHDHAAAQALQNAEDDERWPTGQPTGRNRR